MSDGSKLAWAAASALVAVIVWTWYQSSVAPGSPLNPAVPIGGLGSNRSAATTS